MRLKKMSDEIHLALYIVVALAVGSLLIRNRMGGPGPDMSLLEKWKKFRKWDCESRDEVYKYEDGRGHQDV
jgi:hypothetical protein